MQCNLAMFQMGVYELLIIGGFALMAAIAIVLIVWLLKKK